MFYIFNKGWNINEDLVYTCVKSLYKKVNIAESKFALSRCFLVLITVNFVISVKTKKFNSKITFEHLNIKNDSVNPLIIFPVRSRAGPNMKSHMYNY